jgi:hypothetical protein
MAVTLNMTDAMTDLPSSAFFISIFPCAIEPLHSRYPWVFSGMLVAMYFFEKNRENKVNRATVFIRFW